MSKPLAPAAVSNPPMPDVTQPAPKRSLRRFRLRLSGKFGVAFVGLVTLVLLIHGAVDLFLNFEDAKRTAIEVQREKARAAAERVQAFLSEIENQIGWTTRAEWRRVAPEQRRYDFIRLLRQAPAITEVAYLDPSGREQLRLSRLEPDAIGSGKDFSATPLFTEALKDKIWFGPVYFRRGSEPYMTIAVAHSGRDPGVTVAEVNLKLIWDVVSSIKIGEGGYAFVVTSNGHLIAHPDLSLVLRDTDLSNLPEVAIALASIEAGDKRQSDDYEITTGIDGGSVLAARATIPRVDWIVFVQLPLREAMQPLIETVIQTVSLFFLSVLLATVAGTYLARRMVVPIRQLQDGAERFGAGDLSERIVIRTGDEIETLAHRFNLMASRVQESYETLEAKVEERTRDLNKSLDDLQKAQSRLVQSEKLASLGQLTAGIAHEIKNPLTPIQLSAERIRRRYGKYIENDREIFDRCVDTIIRQVSDIGRMVDEFSTFARMPKPKLEDRDLREALREAVFMREMGDHGIEFETHIGDEPLLGSFDIRLLSQAFGNLVKNAVEAMETLEGHQGRVSLSADRAGDHHVVDIADNGRGFPKEDRERLLEPYMTTREKGTGLGLAIVRKIVEEHGGTIELADAPDVPHGALVRIRLPAGASAQARPHETSSKNGDD